VTAPDVDPVTWLSEQGGFVLEEWQKQYLTASFLASPSPVAIRVPRFSGHTGYTPQLPPILDELDQIARASRRRPRAHLPAGTRR
jgi:hypothetical protein